MKIRENPGLKKKPSTSELIDWIKLILSDDLSQEELTNKIISKNCLYE